MARLSMGICLCALMSCVVQTAVSRSLDQTYDELIDLLARHFKDQRRESQGFDVAGFKAYPGKYISGFNLEKITDVSVNECAQRCRDFMLSWYDYRCASFDYDTKQRICYISDRNTETVILGEYFVGNADFVYYERDYGFCKTVPDERIPIDGSTEALCRSVGGCWDGYSKCFESKSKLRRITCTGNCIEVRTAMLSGDPRLQQMYFDAAYAEVKSMITLPNTFWQWLDANIDARKALLTTQWPVDHETVENFYLLWKHFGEEYTASHFHLLLATAFNRRDFGMGTHPSFIGVPGYWSWWAQGLTFLIDADSKLLKEDLSSSQKKLMAASEDAESKKLEEESSDVKKRAYEKKLFEKRGNTPDFSECQTVKGARGYIGTKTTTKKGHTCQRWDKQQPQDHTQEAKTNDATYFPDPTLSDAANHCRNPTGKDDLWCYITDTSAGYSWDYCDVPTCDCKVTKPDIGYMGTIHKTVKGYTCQRWDSQTPISHTHNPKSNDASYFPDETLADAANYCRNPDRDRGLWCYVVDGGNDPWDFCDVPDCVDTESRCEFPFTSPRTGVEWNRCALEMWVSSSPYCIDKFGQNIGCTKNHYTRTLKDDACHFPYYPKEGGAPVSHCTEGSVPWCGTSENVWKKWEDNAKYCLPDYGLGSNQHKWTDTFSDPVKDKEFRHMVNGYLSTCSQYKSVNELPFPPRDDGMNAFEAVDFLKEKAEKYGGYLSIFPTLTAPWPVLLHLNADLPHNESEWVWRRWLDNEPMITYGIYSGRILDASKSMCRPSVWSTYAVPRIKEDGGICGQLSLQAKYTWISLGGPANLVSEPGHLALFAIHHNPKVVGNPLEGPFFFKRYQNVYDEIDAVSSSHMTLDRHSLTLAGKPVRRKVNLDFERGIVFTINKGYGAFEKARITQNIFNRLPPADKAAALVGLVDGMRDHPYYAHLWYDIADFLTGEIVSFSSNTVRYPTTCRNVPGLDKMRTELKAIADTNFYDKRVFQQTYLDVVTRMVYPPSCCKSDSTILPGLEAEVVKMNAWKTRYGDYIKMNVAKCKTYLAGTSKRNEKDGENGCPVCETVKPILIRNGNAFDNSAIENFASTLEDTLDMLLNVPNPDENSVIAFLKEIAKKIPHILVGEKDWAVAIQYDMLSKRLIALLKKTGQVTEAAEREAYKDELANEANGSNMTFWKDLADRKKLAGQYEGILSGKKVWKPKLGHFKTKQ